MNKLQQRVQQRGQGGFTLIELLVVIAILAILGGVVVFAVGNSTETAKTAACQAESKTLSTAAQSAKATRLSETTPSSTIFNFLDGPTTGTAPALVYTGKYFTATGSATGVTFAAIGTTPPNCNLPGAVTY